MKILLIINKIVSYLPLTWFISFWIFVLRAYIKLGHFPSYNHPDPKDLGMSLNYNLAVWGAVYAVLSIIVWLITIVCIGIIDRKKLVRFDIFLYIISFVFIIIFARSNVFGLSDWLVD